MGRKDQGLNESEETVDLNCRKGEDRWDSGSSQRRDMVNTRWLCDLVEVMIVVQYTKVANLSFADPQKHEDADDILVCTLSL